MCMRAFIKKKKRFIVYFFKAYAIKCWNCRSDSDPKCGDPFDNSSFPILDCNSEPELEHLPGVRPTMCRKIRQKSQGEWRYFRSCAYMGEPGIEGDERFCLMRTGSYNIFMEYCTCNAKDGCNGGNDLTPNRFVAVAVSTTLVGVLARMLQS